LYSKIFSKGFILYLQDELCDTIAIRYGKCDKITYSRDCYEILEFNEYINSVQLAYYKNHQGQQLINFFITTTLRRAFSSVMDKKKKATIIRTFECQRNEKIVAIVNLYKWESFWPIKMIYDRINNDNNNNNKNENSNKLTASSLMQLEFINNNTAVVNKGNGSILELLAQDKGSDEFWESFYQIKSFDCIGNIDDNNSSYESKTNNDTKTNPCEEGKSSDNFDMVSNHSSFDCDLFEPNFYSDYDIMINEKDCKLINIDYNIYPLCENDVKNAIKHGYYEFGRGYIVSIYYKHWLFMIDGRNLKNRRYTSCIWNVSLI